MRAVILILILGVVALIIAVASGLIDIRQIRAADAPELSASSSGVTASGGQAPAFDIETGKVEVGSQGKNVTVRVPTLEVQRPEQNNSPPAVANSTN